MTVADGAFAPALAASSRPIDRTTLRAAGLGAGLALAGAAASMAATGHLYGVGNNLFHLPILGALYDDPVFARDAFVQSLRDYSAGPFMLLAGSERYVSAETTLLVLGFVSRALAFAGFLACAAVLGVKGAAPQALFVALIATIDILSGYAFGGGAGLFLPYATHSELANGVLLFSWAYAARGRLTAALATSGLVFFCNSFMGVWALVAVFAALWADLAGRRIAPQEAARRSALGCALAFAFASPALVSILANPEFGAAPAFDYRAYLNGYWPQHFLFESLPGFELVGLASVIALAGVSLSALGAAARPFGAILLGSLALYAAGVVAPHLTDSPVVLNLHLLRVSGPLTLIAALAACSLIAVWTTGPDGFRARVIAPIVAGLLCVLHAPPLVALPILALGRRPARWKSAVAAPLGGPAATRVMAAGFATMLGLALALETTAARKRNADLVAFAADWSRIADWARAETPTEALFLTPVVDFTREPRTAAERATARAADAAARFEHRARRRVFVDFKRGAAVMWRPSYHAEWRSRADAVLALPSRDERLDYAAANGVAFVVELCGPAEAGALTRAGALCVFASAARPAG